MQEKQPAVSIMTNKRNGTLYTGVTSGLGKRIYQHKAGLTGGFSRRYACTRLVYFELFEDMTAAIAREEQIKAGSRRKKLVLIEGLNPQWDDLTAHLF